MSLPDSSIHRENDCGNDEVDLQKCSCPPKIRPQKHLPFTQNLNYIAISAGYKSNNSTWLKYWSSGFLNSFFISSSCKAIFSKGECSKSAEFCEGFRAISAPCAGWPPADTSLQRSKSEFYCVEARRIVLDPKISLDPLEKQLDLPALLVKFGNRHRRKFHVIGQEH